MNLLCADEAAFILGVSYRSILTQIRKGNLVARKVGHEYRIHRDNLEKFARCEDLKNGGSDGRTISTGGNLQRSPGMRLGAESQVSPLEEPILRHLRGEL